MDNIDVVTRQEEKEICVSMRLRLRKCLWLENEILTVCERL